MLRLQLALLPLIVKTASYSMLEQMASRHRPDRN